MWLISDLLPAGWYEIPVPEGTSRSHEASAAQCEVIPGSAISVFIFNIYVNGVRFVLFAYM